MKERVIVGAAVAVGFAAALFSGVHWWNAETSEAARRKAVESEVERFYAMRCPEVTSSGGAMSAVMKAPPSLKMEMASERQTGRQSLYIVNTRVDREDFTLPSRVQKKGVMEGTCEVTLQIVPGELFALPPRRPSIGAITCSYSQPDGDGLGRLWALLDDRPEESTFDAVFVQKEDKKMEIDPRLSLIQLSGYRRTKNWVGVSEVLPLLLLRDQREKLDDTWETRLRSEIEAVRAEGFPERYWPAKVGS